MVRALRHNTTSVQQNAYPRTEHSHPGWYDELASSLAIQSQFLISGNTRDRYVSTIGPEEGFLTFEQTLWRIIRRKRLATFDLAIDDNHRDRDYR